ncbi:unnamed protein product, partial [Brassica rapa]
PYGYVKVNYDGSKRQHMSTGGFFLDGGQSKRADVKFRRIPREDNKAADSLAKQFQDSSKFCNSFYYVSLSITYILIHEDHY